MIYLRQIQPIFFLSFGITLILLLVGLLVRRRQLVD
jgi:LPXTG-motif cell wall-anchored protein